ncbi:MAG: bifunctional oligoribonuclease/PAP phosphatase NrnA [Candidatus Margulisiibacteriota bacterium]|nr:bifunctional oligoribonuclease/PAP phosphatase NrnA [Candidatus Margulisiibacteriota bacterium]
MREILATIKKALKGARTALVVSHVDPDGDSIGSMISMAMIMTSMGINTDMYSKDGIPRVYRFLPWMEKVKNELRNDLNYDLLVAVDSSSKNRLGDDVDIREIANKVINIDHHPDNTNYGDMNFVEKCSSAAELVYRLAKYLEVEITEEMAENLYAALITDTGNYRYENTSAATFEMAGDLIKAGVDTHDITTKIYDTKSIASIHMLALALATLETSPDRKAAWITVTQEMMDRIKAKGEDLVGLVDIIRSIEGVEVAIQFREDHNKVKVNLRSKEKVNVSDIAKRFGGGGHIRAAGAIISGNIEDAKEKVIAEVTKYLKAMKYLV